MNKNQLLTILKINGYSPESSDDEIRTVLLNARYSEAEIDRALMIIRESNLAQPIRSDGLHTVFYTDNHLRPSEIAGLLGIDVKLNFDSNKLKKHEESQLSLSEVFAIAVLSIIIAVSGLFIYMYLNGVGAFHPLELLSL